MQDPAPSLSAEDAALIERYITGRLWHRIPPSDPASVARVNDLVSRGVLEARLTAAGFATFRLTSDGYLAMKAFKSR